MSDQCKHCTYRGDYLKCTSAECFHHESWIDIVRIARIEKLEKALREIEELPSYRMDEAFQIALNALEEPIKL